MRIRHQLLFSACCTLVGALALGVPSAWAAFPGTNGKISFSTTRVSFQDIYTMDPDGTDQADVSLAASSDDNSAWSADGTKIVFQRGARIWKMNADGSGQTQLTFVCCDGMPGWSPDGTNIVFMSSRDGNREIYTMNADGSAQTNITNDAALDDFPAWSPDGTQIAFRSTRGTGDAIYKMNTDGTGVTLVISAGGVNCCADWSPDGSKIVYHTNRYGSGPDTEIQVVNADGTGDTRLTSTTPRRRSRRMEPRSSSTAHETSPGAEMPRSTS